MAQNTFPSSGNVGIGTTTPGTSLDAHTNASAISVGDNANTSVNAAFGGSRAYVGYDGNAAVLQGATKAFCLVYGGLAGKRNPRYSSIIHLRRN